MLCCCTQNVCIVGGALSCCAHVSVETQVEMKDPGSQAPPSEKDRGLRPAGVQSRFKVVDLTDDEFDHLQGGSLEASARLKVMAVAAGILELLSEGAHARVLVAQGGLPAVCKALEWDLSPDINTACASSLLKLAEDPACLQAVNLPPLLPSPSHCGRIAEKQFVFSLRLITQTLGAIIWGCRQ